MRDWILTPCDDGWRFEGMVRFDTAAILRSHATKKQLSISRIVHKSIWIYNGDYEYEGKEGQLYQRIGSRITPLEVTRELSPPSESLAHESFERMAIN
ncbi:MAG: hypothetical protein JWL85_710, partial [Candidatus Saccharibacteria bacterium]|nr:hypothetical protein [Candidatus Saccharibacteria bacterium]